MLVALLVTLIDPELGMDCRHASAALGLRQHLTLWSVCYLLLHYRWLLPGPALRLDLMNGAGATLLIALILVSPQAQALLGTWPVVWLGSLSFSLYLVHVPTTLALVRLAPERLPTWAVLVGAALLSIPVAWAVFHPVERPSIWLGRVLSQHIGAAQARAAINRV